MTAGELELMRGNLAAAEELAAELHGAGVEVLLDDRPKVSPGVKFADAELLGAPVVVVVGRVVQLLESPDDGLVLPRRVESVA